MLLKKEKDISDLIINKFNEVEDKLSEYKLITQIIILPEIKLLFPIISHVNIFSFIKKGVTSASILSVDPSSTTIISSGARVCAATLCSARMIVLAELYAGMMTETLVM